MGSIAGMVMTDTNRSTGRRTSVPLCAPQIPHLKFGSGRQASLIPSLKIDPEGLVSYKVSFKFGSEVQVSYNVSKLILRHPVLPQGLRKIAIKHVSQTQLSLINGTPHCYMFRFVRSHHQAFYVLLTGHPGMTLVNIQLDAHFTYVYFFSVRKYTMMCQPNATNLYYVC